MNYLLPLFRWCDASWAGEMIRGSRYLFPVIEGIHLLGLTVLLGIVVLVSMRLFGLVLREQSTRELAAQLAPYHWISIVTMLVTGYLLFASEALKCFDSPPFRLKMLFLILALIFQVTVYRKATTSDQVDSRRLAARSAATLNLVLWFGVGLAGRAIGFLLERATEKHNDEAPPEQSNARARTHCLSLPVCRRLGEPRG